MESTSVISPSNLLPGTLLGSLLELGLSANYFTWVTDPSPQIPRPNSSINPVCIQGERDCSGYSPDRGYSRCCSASSGAEKKYSKSQKVQVMLPGPCHREDKGWGRTWYGNCNWNQGSLRSLLGNWIFYQRETGLSFYVEEEKMKSRPSPQFQAYYEIMFFLPQKRIISNTAICKSQFTPQLNKLRFQDPGFHLWELPTR